MTEHGLRGAQQRPVEAGPWGLPLRVQSGRGVAREPSWESPQPSPAQAAGEAHVEDWEPLPVGLANQCKIACVSQSCPRPPGMDSWSPVGLCRFSCAIGAPQSGALRAPR
ncbi:hypothetical protein KIL84_016266 [Mauremys mutica]|uniref:Uncharacterized protein n=1 Tax=Mauremys mutica TaxID=74926 RepID=A0A9D3WN62_9SAUR|nr:hypothetical protein KIL84_016266 [Mauremys mutica]